MCDEYLHCDCLERDHDEIHAIHRKSFHVSARNLKLQYVTGVLNPNNQYDILLN
jgi:hypothetical protein